MSMAIEPAREVTEKPMGQKPLGLQCPNCASRHFETDRTLPVVLGVRRKRICRNCGTVVFTKETIWTVPPQK